MGRFHDYDDEFAKADARERELQRQMGMQDGPSRPVNNGFSGYSGPNAYGGFNNQNNFSSYNNYAQPQQQSIWDQAGQSKFVTGLNGRTTKPIDPRAAKTALTVIAVVFFIVAVFLFAVMFICVRTMRKEYEKCTEQVEAVVVQNVLTNKQSGKGTTFYAEFEYEYNGTVYKSMSRSGQKPAKYSVGQKVTLHIDPNDPSTFYDEKEDTLVMIVISSIAGVFLLLAVIFTAASLSKKKQIQSMMQ